MRKYLILLAILLLTTRSSAGIVDRYYTYDTTSVVTDVNLNGNLNNLVNEINGNLDNNNADTVSGFRFIEILGSFPAAGQQGRVVYNSTTDELGFDTGSLFKKSIVITGTPANGDLLYYDGTNWVTLTGAAQGDTLYFNSLIWTRLSAGTDGQALTTNGAGANPAWQGMTTQGDVEYYSGSARTRLAPGTDGQFLQTNGAGQNPSWVDQSVIYKSPQVTMTTATESSNITIAADKRYHVFLEGQKITGNGTVGIRFNDDTGNNYDYKANTFYMDATADATAESEAASALIMTGAQAATSGALKCDFTIETTKRNSDSAFAYGSCVYDAVTGGYALGHFAGAYDADVTISSFEISIGGDTFTGTVTMYELTTSP